MYFFHNLKQDSLSAINLEFAWPGLDACNYQG